MYCSKCPESRPFKGCVATGTLLFSKTAFRFCLKSGWTACSGKIRVIERIVPASIMEFYEIVSAALPNTEHDRTDRSVISSQLLRLLIWADFIPDWIQFLVEAHGENQFHHRVLCWSHFWPFREIKSLTFDVHSDWLRLLAAIVAHVTTLFFQSCKLSVIVWLSLWSRLWQSKREITFKIKSSIRWLQYGKDNHVQVSRKDIDNCHQ